MQLRPRMQAYEGSLGENAQTQTFVHYPSLRPRGETDITRRFGRRILGSTPGEGTKPPQKIIRGSNIRTRNDMLYSMRKDKEKATELRRLGKSYREIHAVLKVPKATLSGWFKELDWSGEIKKRLAREIQIEHTARITKLGKIRGEHLKRAYQAARHEAESELTTLKYNPLFIAGVMLYWGEGGKSPKDGVKFTNTDAKMIAFYVDFLTKACRVPMGRIKVHLLLYPDLEERICRSYWSKMSGVPQENFTKSTVIVGRHKVRRLNWGVCMVTVSSLYFKQKMLKWMELLPVELLKSEYYENIVPSSGAET